MKWIDESQEAAAREMMNWSKDYLLPQIEPQLQKLSTALCTFPSFGGLSCSVQLRAVQPNRYNGTETIENYKPNITGVVPVASIHIRTTDDDNCFFQVDTDQAFSMINAFKALMKDLESLQTSFELKKKSE